MYFGTRRPRYFHYSILSQQKRGFGPVQYTPGRPRYLYFSVLNYFLQDFFLGFRILFISPVFLITSNLFSDAKSPKRPRSCLIASSSSSFVRLRLMTMLEDCFAARFIICSRLRLLLPSGLFSSQSIPHIVKSADFRPFVLAGLISSILVRMAFASVEISLFSWASTLTPFRIIFPVMTLFVFIILPIHNQRTNESA